MPVIVLDVISLHDLRAYPAGPCLYDAMRAAQHERTRDLRTCPALRRFHTPAKPDAMGCVSLGSGQARLVLKVRLRRVPPVVVRVNTFASEHERAKAEREAHVLALQLPFAPRLYGWERHSPWFAEPALCLEFTEGQHLAMAGSRRRRRASAR